MKCKRCQHSVSSHFPVPEPNSDNICRTCERTGRSCSCFIEHYVKPKEEQPSIAIEGNKGGDVVEITRLDANKIHIRVGWCCTYVLDKTFTAEEFAIYIAKAEGLQTE